MVDGPNGGSMAKQLYRFSACMGFIIFCCELLTKAYRRLTSTPPALDASARHAPVPFHSLTVAVVVSRLGISFGFATLGTCGREEP